MSNGTGKASISLKNNAGTSLSSASSLAWLNLMDAVLILVFDYDTAASSGTANSPTLSDDTDD
ncbi:MAG: hypothetical protein ABIU05_08210 [Nitrospirales bacterium]